MATSQHRQQSNHTTIDPGTFAWMPCMFRCSFAADRHSVSVTSARLLLADRPVFSTLVPATLLRPHSFHQHQRRTTARNEIRSADEVSARQRRRIPRDHWNVAGIPWIS
ncbi:hypothetical protein Aduo_012907 [Ancylostoma duodenale]